MANSGFIVRIDGRYYAEDWAGQAYFAKIITEAAVFDYRSAERVASLTGGTIQTFQLLRVGNEAPIWLKPQ